MSDEVDPVQLEEERLMRAMSRKGNVTSPRTPLRKVPSAQSVPTTDTAQKQSSDPSKLPKWKQLQLEREEEERKRLEDERKKKEEAAKLIEARVQEFGSNVDQDNEEIEKYLTSPSGDKPAVEQPESAFVDPISLKKDDSPQREEELSSLPSYDEREPDERAAKEEERLMKMIAGTK